MKVNPPPSTLQKPAFHLRSQARTGSSSLAREIPIEEEDGYGRDWLRDQFVAHLSHEIRNPLNAVIGLLRRMESGRQLPSEEFEALRAAADYLQQTVEHAMDFSRSGLQDVNLRQRPMDIRRLAESACQLYRGLAAERNVRLKCEVSGDTEGTLLGDEPLLLQIIGNLIHNAIRHTESGVVELRMAVEDGYCGRELVITVADTGIGICATDQAKIFQPFVRGSQSAAGGTGLGLAVIRSFVHVMGGQLDLLSEVGGGSRFTIHVPVEIKQINTTVTTSEGDWQPDPMLAGKRVLIVEDLVFNRVYLQSLLSQWGCLVDEAADGMRGLELALANPYDWILTDLDVPGRSGLELARQLYLQQSPCATKIIAICGNDCAQLRRECEHAGIIGFVTKPVHPQTLHQLMLINAPQATGTHSCNAVLEGPGLLADTVAFPDWNLACARWCDEYWDLRYALKLALKSCDAAAIKRSFHRLLGHLKMLNSKKLHLLLQDVLARFDSPGFLDAAHAAWQRLTEDEAELIHQLIKRQRPVSGDRDSSE